MVIYPEKVRRHGIAFYRSGKIDIAAPIVTLLNLQEGDVISIVSSNGNDFYLVRRKQNAGGGYDCRVRSVNHGKYMRTYSADLCKTMLELCNKQQIARIPCGDSITFEDYGKGVLLLTRLSYE